MAAMTIELNGEAKEVPEGATVADLVKLLDLASGRFAVEVNKAIVPRSQLAERSLTAGDHVEIIGFVGGG